MEEWIGIIILAITEFIGGLVIGIAIGVGLCNRRDNKNE